MGPKRAASLGILVGLAALSLKLAAAYLSGSVAVFSDALETVVNVATALLAAWAVHYAARPADATHPFGHTKAEYLAAVVEGVLIVLAAGAILWRALGRFLHPAGVEALLPTSLLLLFATLLNGAWGLYLFSLGKKVRSVALTAEAWHLLTDLFTTLGVLFGLWLARVLDAWWLDPLMGVLIAAWVVAVGLRLLGRSLGGLLDAALDPEDQAAIERAVAEAMTGAIEVHDLRTRRAGARAFVELHLVVPGGMTVEEAHAIADRIESAVQRVYPGAEVTVHVEPEGEAQHRGIRPARRG